LLFGVRKKRSKIGECEGIVAENSNEQEKSEVAMKKMSEGGN
jgi:hypothetical protein